MGRFWTAEVVGWVGSGGLRKAGGHGRWRRLAPRRRARTLRSWYQWTGARVGGEGSGKEILP